MILSEILDSMREGGTLSDEQHKALSDLHLKKVFSLYMELRVAFYTGILFLTAGLGLTINKYASEFAADIIVITTLTAGFLSTLVYCFIKGDKYTVGESAAPGIFFDYILYLSCIIYSLNIAYVEARFALFGELWRIHLLISSVMFFFLAYRFDNRLVLSFAMSSLAGWIGFEIHAARAWLWDEMRFVAIAYGLVVLACGTALYSRGIKRHFLDIYLNFAAHFVFIALLTGVFERQGHIVYFIFLIAACAVSVIYAQKTRSFLYLVYAVIYGYIGLSAVLMRRLEDITEILGYLIVSSAAVLWWLFSMSRKYQVKE
jgi:hypothetical protein